MPLVDRGLTILTKGDVHDNFAAILVPLEFLTILLVPVLLFTSQFKFKNYVVFPDNLFKVILCFDWLYAMVLGPFRWLPNNAVFEYMTDPTTTEGCKAVVWLDTFCQLGILVSNTALVTCVFYMVYFRTKINEKTGEILAKFFWILIVLSAGGIATVNMMSDVHNYVGWCTADSIHAIFKQICSFLALVIQVTMIIPTNWMLYEEGNKKNSKNALPTGFILRYVSSVTTQLAGVLPLMGVEFLGLARKPVPSTLMWVVIICLPCAHLFDCLMFTIKFWPIVLGELDGGLRTVLFCTKYLVAWAEEEEEKMTYKNEESEGKKKKKKKSKKRNESLFERMPFWLHLVLTLAIPFLLLCGFSVYMVVERDDIIKKADLIRQDIYLTSLITNHVHETQKERGATGVFMGSAGTKFQCEIKNQYTVTDVQMAILQRFLNTEFRNVKLVTKITFLMSLSMMIGIPAHRVDVQTLSIPKGTALSYYTNHNMYFVGVVALVCRTSTLEDKAIAHLIYSNLAFVSAKEKAGVERAKGSVAFAAGGWTSQGAYRTFVELVSAQDTHLYFFETYVSFENLAVYERTLLEEVSRVSQKMRNIALNADAAIMDLYEGEEWFNNMTGKLNLVRQVEGRLAGQLRTESETIVSSTTSAMVLIITILAGVLIVDGLMILGLARTSDHLKRFQVGDEKEEKRKKRKMSKLDTFLEGIRNLGFVYQVLVPVMLCALGLIGVSWLIMMDQVTASQLAAATYENMNLQFFMSNFIHETQKERGATGVFMGSGGTKMSDALMAQTKLCNSKRDILYLYMDTEYVDYEDMMNHWTLVFWLGQSYRLDEIRVSARALNVTSGYALGYYTTMNKHIVASVSEMAFRGSSKTVEARLLAYLGFMFMKEKAGNERAVGTLGMGQGLWPTRLDWRKFIQLVAIQKNAYLYFEQFGSTESKDLWFSLQDSLANQILNPWQAGALANDSAVMVPVDSADWFTNMTAKINEWRLVEKMVANELTSFFDALEEETNNFLYGISIMVGVLFLFTIHIGVKGIRLLLRSNAYNLYQDKLKEEKLRAKAKAKAKAKKEAKRKKKAEKAKALKSKK